MDRRRDVRLSGGAATRPESEQLVDGAPAVEPVRPQQRLDVARRLVQVPRPQRQRACLAVERPLAAPWSCHPRVLRGCVTVALLDVIG